MKSSAPRGGERPSEAACDASDLSAQLADLRAATGGLAHEIRNPLSTLRVNLRLLAEDWREIASGKIERPSEIAEIGRRSAQKIDALTREIDRLSQTLEDFLRFARSSELTLVDADLCATATELVEFFEPQAAAANVRFIVKRDASSLPVRCDVNLINQAMLNLLLNALQAMPSGGELTLRASRLAGAARIEVIDTGPGIPPDQVGRIFEPYYSTRPGGTGLGLPTARRIIAQHGGKLTVESQPGKGSRFIIELPLR